MSKNNQEELQKRNTLKEKNDNLENVLLFSQNPLEQGENQNKPINREQNKSTTSKGISSNEIKGQKDNNIISNLNIRNIEEQQNQDGIQNEIVNPNLEQNEENKKYNLDISTCVNTDVESKKKSEKLEKISPDFKNDIKKQKEKQNRQNLNNINNNEINNNIINEDFSYKNINPQSNNNNSKKNENESLGINNPEKVNNINNKSDILSNNNSNNIDGKKDKSPKYKINSNDNDINKKTGLLNNNLNNNINNNPNKYMNNNVNNNIDKNPNNYQNNNNNMNNNINNNLNDYKDNNNSNPNNYKNNNMNNNSNNYKNIYISNPNNYKRNNTNNNMNNNINNNPNNYKNNNINNPNIYKNNNIDNNPNNFKNNNLIKNNNINNNNMNNFNNNNINFVNSNNNAVNVNKINNFPLDNNQSHSKHKTNQNNNQLNYKSDNRNKQLIINNNNKDKNKEVKYSFSRYTKEPMTGLMNLGDTSYLNSVLRLIGSIRNIASFFLNPNNQKYIYGDIKSYHLSFVICRLFIHLYPYPEKDRKIYKPDNLLKVLGYSNIVFKSKKRRNPNDLIIFILNELHKELNKCKNEKIDNISNKNIFDKSTVIKFEIKKFIDTNNSIISNQLNWFEIKESKCTRCNQCVYNFYSFNIFELDIDRTYKYKNNSINLIDCLLYHKLPKNQKLFCNQCKDYKQILNTLNIFSLSKTIIFSLNRGNLDEPNLLYLKFDIQEKLDLTFLVEKNKSPTQYELNGIISLTTENNNFVYVCFYKSPIDHQWYFSNNENVQRIELNNIINMHNNERKFIPCILNYKDFGHI